MPYIHITTSKTLSADEKRDLRACTLRAVTLLGKKPEHAMVRIEDGATLSRGAGDGECAFCDARLLGAASREACDAFAQALSADLARIAQTAPQCVYLSLSELALCYTDGRLPPGH